MTDYSVKVSVRNGRILRMMREHGIATQAELARRAGLRMTDVNQIVNLRRKPIGAKGQFFESVERMAAIRVSAGSGDSRRDRRARPEGQHSDGAAGTPKLPANH